MLGVEDTDGGVSIVLVHNFPFLSRSTLAGVDIVFPLGKHLLIRELLSLEAYDLQVLELPEQRSEPAVERNCEILGINCQMEHRGYRQLLAEIVKTPTLR